MNRGAIEVGPASLVVPREVLVIPVAARRDAVVPQPPVVVPVRRRVFALRAELHDILVIAHARVVG